MVHDQDLVSIQEVREKVEKSYAAWLTYRTFPQDKIDAIVEAMAAAGRANARELARMAVEETSYGNVEDKVAKNLLCADLLPRRIRGMKTVGVLRELPEERVTEIGVPMGVVAAILPTTNPTSTAIYKSIISLKAGNGVVHSPHPRAKNCTCYTVALLTQAAVAAGAPPDLIQCVNNATLEGTNELMRHRRTGVILSTGGAGIVKAAYSSGKPAFGVGPGNVPVLIDPSADVPAAVGKVVAGKSFDYGTVCSSEQTVVAESGLRDTILKELRARGAYLMNEQERAAVERILFVDGYRVSAQCVGQSPQKIAELAGFKVAPEIRILVAEIAGVGKQFPLSAEKLSPVLALHFVSDFNAGVDACEAILRFGGLGHTSVIFASDEAKVRHFGLRMPSFRVLVNTSAPQGSVGITTNVLPSMTLGCGAMAGNATSDNVGPLHLINIKRIAWAVRTPEEAFPDPPPAQASVSSSAAPLDRDAVVAAVEKFLAQKGVSVKGGTAPAAPAAKAAPVPVRSVVESVVDQFLSRRPSSAAAAAPSCGCALPAAAPAPVPAVQAAPAATPAPPPAPPQASPPPPAPKIDIVDFVCEADVRAAITQSRKIYIGPRTIVTPAARELAGPGEILVMAQR